MIYRTFDGKGYTRAWENMDSKLAIDGYQYKPSHVLLRDKVQYTNPCRPKLESLQELRMLALCTRSRIPRDLLRVIAQFVIQKYYPEGLVALDIITWGGRLPLLVSQDTRIVELVRQLREKNYNAWTLVHISAKTMIPRLMYYRDPFQDEMISPPLTEQQRRWLYARTIVEAGIEDGDVIDNRYSSDAYLLLEQLDPELPLPEKQQADDDVKPHVITPNWLRMSTRIGHYYFPDELCPKEEDYYRTISKEEWEKKS